MQEVDVAVIGSGGGAKLALALQRLGRSVALIEESHAGGTCLNRGCIPSKMLIYPAGLLQSLRAAGALHLRGLSSLALDVPALVDEVQAHIQEQSRALEARLANAERLTYLRGSAQFVADHELAVGTQRLRAERVVIATGSRPALPPIPGLAATPFMTSTDALRRREPPRRLAVLGGGYIAAELGGAFQGFGSEVTCIVRSTLLKREDPEVIDVYRQALPAGMRWLEHTAVRRIEGDKDGVRVCCEGPDGGPFDVEADALLVAVGVTPNADALGLENTGVRRTPEGFVETDEFLRTAVPGVFALGDVAGRHLFRHSVNFEAEYWIDAHCLASEPYPIRYPPMPHAVFGHPEIASVGWTEPEARARGASFITAGATYASCAMARARGLHEGLVKLVCERPGGRLLGAHVVGAEASTLVQELTQGVTHGLSVFDLYRAIYIHPAFPEVVRNALRAAWATLDPRGARRF